MEARSFGVSRSEPTRRPDASFRRPDPNTRRSEPASRRSPTLAVDLGTAGSSAILVTAERDIVIEDPDLARPVWPSAVAHDGAGPRVGGAAESVIRVHPQRGLTQLKHLLGHAGPVRLGDSMFQPVELLGWLLSAMRAEAGRAGGVDVVRAAMAVPVEFGAGDPRRNMLLAAASLAGFGTVDLIFEPIATVAASLVGGPLAAGDIVLVCDLGASSFRASLVRVTKAGAPELLGHTERPECSGMEIDRVLMAELLDRAGLSWADLGDPHDPAQQARAVRARRDLAERARRMKHQLSTHSSVVELIGPDEVPVELTEQDLRTLVAPMVIAAVDAFRPVLVAGGIRHNDLTSVLLSGGGMRMPVVAEVAGNTFRRPIRMTVDQHRAVVEGTARFARAAEHRHVRARVALDRETPMRWDLPGGTGGDLHWLVPVGARFNSIEPLAVVRLPDGGLWELRAGRAGTLTRVHAQNGDPVVSDDWLVTVELDVRPFR